MAGTRVSELEEKVFKAEYDTIIERRKKVNSEEGRSEAKLVAATTPSTDLNLVGLAFSGGGIRSATFNLGVVQALAERGILKHADYLSTVSGGGYIGSCLSTLLNNPTTYPYLRTSEQQAKESSDQKTAPVDPFPLRHRKGVEEPAALQHLRNSSNYLTGSGTLAEKMRLPTLFLRGLLVNLLILFPYLAFAIFLTRLVPQDHATTLFSLSRWVLLGWGIVMIGGYVVGNRWLFKRSWQGRNLSELAYSATFLAVIAFALLEILPFLLYHYDQLTTDWWRSHAPSLTGVLAALGSLAGFQGTQTSNSQQSPTILSKLAIPIVALAGLLVFLLLYLQIGYWLMYSGETVMLSFGDSTFNAACVFYFSAAVIFVLTRLCVDVNATSSHSFYRDRLSKAYIFRTQKNAQNETHAVHQDDLKLSQLNTNTPAPYHLVNVTLNLQASDDPNLRGRNADFFILSKHFCGSERTGYVKTTTLEHIDPHLNLATAMAISAAAAAPNMGTATSGLLSYLLALLNIRLGYWLANPKKLTDNTGKEIQSHSFIDGFSRRARPIYLMWEALNKVDANKKLVNLSDGGHLENLGVYELLRRRCTYIICGDAEADPDMTFGGLATLIRFARIDFAIDIEIDLDDLRTDEKGYSRRHCALGTIKYPGGEVGQLLYIKSSVIGNENEYIREYRSHNPSFPHQSTADQFFDEAQFEAYRALGYKAAQSIFKFTPASIDGLSQQGVAQEEQRATKHQETIEELFGRLESQLRPRPALTDQFVSLQEQLSHLEESYSEPAIAAYSYHIYPELSADKGQTGGPNSQDKLAIFHFCNRQMQLMENVFFALKLDRKFNQEHPMNRGWMNLFRRWVETPHFLEAWGISIGTFSVGFEEFCKTAFQLKREIEWEPDTAHQHRSLSEEEELKPYERPGTQVYQANLQVRLDSIQNVQDFPIGLAVIQPADEKEAMTELCYYRIRTEFRNMKLLGDMVDTLPKKLAKDTPEKDIKMFIRLDNATRTNRFSAFFRRHGYDVRPGDPLIMAPDDDSGEAS